MGEEFYCVIKLVSGEEIFSLVSVDSELDNPIIVLQNPVVMHMITHQNGTMIKIKPWMQLSSDELFIIRLDKVITMTESKDKKIIELYNRYVSDDYEDIENGEVKVSQEMGYLSSVEESRKRFESLYNDSIES